MDIGGTLDNFTRVISLRRVQYCLTSKAFSMLDSSYKDEKEAFVSGMTGSTVTHINLLSSVALASIFVMYCAQTRTKISLNSISISWLILVLPLLLSMTLFANWPATLFLLISAPGCLLLLIQRKESGTPLPSNLKSPTTPDPSSQEFHTAPRVEPLPSLTIYRAHMLLITCLAILAVDFPVFPRSLVKCETYGVSLMDIGVGSFVFSGGIASAMPLIKTPSHLAAPLIPKMLRAMRKSLPIILLGIVRVLLVKGTEYPEHVSEYGVHWNFFITLALVPIMEVLLHPMMIRVSVTAIGIVVAIIQQLLLSKYSLYVLNAPRVDLISANKEGIVSLPGYFAIHLLGLTTGLLLLPPSPSYFRRIQRSLRNHSLNDTELAQRYGVRQNDKTATELSGYSILWWVLMGLCSLFKLDGGNGVSRRMVNISYIFWICAYNVSFILAYLVLDMVFFPSPSTTRKSKKQLDGTSISSSPAASPAAIPHPLLDAVNKNGLVVFLVANVGTGLINLTIPTMYTSDLWAMIILCGYSYAICIMAWVLRGVRLRL
ncbi:GWT1-domain-containing protein [Lentinula boryana]|uniref:GPI-anchored wall transfer protein n=1 Tax=Lentinula boryana TaxID=40481 RepID=A0ABQ8QCR6_9AGAR|nr:GWT1-domain-containing protein [Lentinula boryana]